MSIRLSSLGAPLPGFIYATGLRFYKSPSRIQIRAFLLCLQVIFESLFQSTFIMGRTQYTNPWVPEGHIHVIRADPSLSHIWARNESAGPCLSVCVGPLGVFFLFSYPRGYPLIKWIGSLEMPQPHVRDAERAQGPVGTVRAAMMILTARLVLFAGFGRRRCCVRGCCYDARAAPTPTSRTHLRYGSNRGTEQPDSSYARAPGRLDNK
jgi:hypothetical protein